MLSRRGQLAPAGGKVHERARRIFSLMWGVAFVRRKNYGSRFQMRLLD